MTRLQTAHPTLTSRVGISKARAEESMCSWQDVSFLICVHELCQCVSGEGPTVTSQLADFFFHEVLLQLLLAPVHFLLPWKIYLNIWCKSIVKSRIVSNNWRASQILEIYKFLHGFDKVSRIFSFFSIFDLIKEFQTLNSSNPFLLQYFKCVSWILWNTPKFERRMKVHRGVWLSK